MLKAFAGCCDRSPHFLVGSKRKAKGLPDDSNTEVLFPSIASFKAHPQNVNCLVAFKPRSIDVEKDEKKLKEDSAEQFDDIALKDLPTCEISLKNGLRDSSLGSEGEGVLLASCSDTIKLFNSSDFSPVATLDNGHERDIKCIAVSEEQSLLFSGSRDCALCIWRVRGKESSLHYKLANIHELIITSVDFNNATSQLLSGSRDSTIKLVDVESQSVAQQLQKISRNLVTCLCWVPQSLHNFVQTSEDKQVYVWDVRQLEPALVFPRKNWIQTSCDVSPNGQLCVSSSNGFDNEGCEVSCWDLKAVKIITEFKSHAQTVHRCKFMPDSNSYFVTVSNDSTVNKWDMSQSARPIDTKRPPTYSGLISLAISRGSLRVYTGAVSGDVYAMKF